MSVMIPTAIQDASSRLVARQFEQSALAVITSATPSSDMQLDGRFERAVVELSNAGGAASLNACKIQAKAHPNGDWFDYITSAELNTGTALAGRLLLVSTNPTTLAASAASRIVIDTTALFAIRISMTTASGTATITIRAGVGTA